MSINEMDSKAAEYFSIMEQIEALQAEAEVIIHRPAPFFQDRGYNRGRNCERRAVKCRKS